MHLQFCHEDRDITGEFHREDDADEVRVWEEDGELVAAVTRTSDGSWTTAPGPGTQETFQSWADALQHCGIPADALGNSS